jgi:hypothetical protein
MAKVLSSVVAAADKAHVDILHRRNRMAFADTLVLKL